ncbi:MAG: class I SAM-dependent methyltransferase [Plesiomonas sp.]|uniref:class I SAM-dependent methyltransferase n=1 Tax=Plesiomonas sp. TaxID=2486279 RepID=UPI003F3EF4B5
MDSARIQTLSSVNSHARKLVLQFLHAITHGTLIIHDDHVGGLTIHRDDSITATLTVHDPLFYRRLLWGGDVAAGEMWMQGQWSSPDPVQVIRLLARNQAVFDKLEARLRWLTAPLNRLRHFLTRNTLQGARKNIAQHYDLGNAMYRLFLDPEMQYSSALFSHPNQSLADAQYNKLKTLCQTLDLQAHDHLLEIGSGWGGLAVYAARHYGCKVTTVTLSQEQFAFAKTRIQAEGLQDRVTLLLQDYRHIQGQFDKVISIEMIEAVGEAFLPGYFAKIASLLTPQGRFLIQGITIRDQRYQVYRSQTDFIRRYIFPGGFLPSLSVILDTLTRHTDLNVVQMHDFGHHYARTLHLWRAAFNEHAFAIQQLGASDEFIRLWDFYFAYCEAGFLERAISVVHITGCKPSPLAWNSLDAPLTH